MSVKIAPPFNIIFFTFNKWPLLILLFLVNFLQSQITFQKYYNVYPNEYSGVKCIRKTNDSGYISLGYKRNINSDVTNTLLIKLDKRGDTIWTKTYYDYYDRGFNHVSQTFDRGYILGGVTMFGPQTTSPCGVLLGYHLQIIKTDSIGNILWAKIFGSDTVDCHHGNTFQSLTQTRDGGYIFAGSKESSYFTTHVNSTYDMYVVRLNSLGDTLWTKTFNYYQGTTFCNSIKETIDGGFIIGGNIYSHDPSGDALLMKLDSVGNCIWQKRYGGTLTHFGDTFNDVEQTSDGGYIASGTTYSFPPDSFNANIYVLKLNSIGDTIWTKTYGGANQDFMQNILKTDNTGHAFLAQGNSFANNQFCLYLIKTNLVGDTVFTKVFGPSSGDCASSSTHDMGYIIGGKIYDSISPYGKWYIVKTDSLGNSGCKQFNANMLTNVTNTVVENTTLLQKSMSIHFQNSPLIIGHSTNSFTECTNFVNIHRSENKNEIKLNLYPNPTSNILNIELFELDGNANIIIENILGKVEFEATTTNLKAIINTNDLAKGIHFIRVKTNKRTHANRIIIE